jgi:glycerol uptake facilitator-like aquaporin
VITTDTLRRYVAEFIATALLLAAVVGSGIMAERLAGPNLALALLCNSLAVGCALMVLILAFGSISGAHMNPAVTLCDAWQRGVSWRDVPGYVLAQISGALAGVALAHAMFDAKSYFLYSVRVRSGTGQILSEFVATFGLLCVIWGCTRTRPSVTPFAVGAYITAAFWFTASTSFANPAVTLARSLTNTFTGIRSQDVPDFIVSQLLGAAAATGLFRWLIPQLPMSASAVVVPHSQPAGDRTTAAATVIFACVHNAGRSQMASAFFNALADPAKAHAISAGTQPAAEVHPVVQETMREAGIDLSHARPQKLTDDLARGASMLITMGCGDQCPFVPGLAREDWPLEDPKGQPPARVREIRDEVRLRVQELVQRNDWQ